VLIWVGFVRTRVRRNIFWLVVCWRRWSVHATHLICLSVAVTVAVGTGTCLLCSIEGELVRILGIGAGKGGFLAAGDEPL
jgi:hypothetical protein